MINEFNVLPTYHIGIHHCQTAEDVIDKKHLLDSLLTLLILQYTHNPTPFDPSLINHISFLHVLLLRLFDHISRELDCVLEGVILVIAFKSCKDEKQQESVVLAIIEGVFKSIVEL